MQVTLDDASVRLAALIQAALEGEDVVIARNDHPVVRLVPVPDPYPGPDPGEGKGKFKMGILKGLVGPGPDFLEPMSEEELQLWEGGP